jgi:hypothetical protein
MRTILLVASVLSLPLLSGCGSDVPRGRIHGTIHYQGKPLNDATVIFIASDKKTHLATLKADGSYEVSGVAYGAIQVSLQHDAPRSSVKGEHDVPSSQSKGVVDEKAGKAPVTRESNSPNRPTLPARYRDSAQSGLQFELSEPNKEWSVDLK